MIRHRPSLARDERGATMTEFAIVLPVMLTLVLGGMDIGHRLYMKSVVQGAMQKAGRDSSLETSDATTQAAYDTKVREQIVQLYNTADVSFTRRFYKSFTKASDKTPETFTDSNSNGTCDGPSGGTPGEPFVDTNRNGRWDRDGADEGQGGAKDSVLYTVTVTYPHIVPVADLFGSGDVTISASTILNNQPYSDQTNYGAPLTGNCT